MRKKLLMAIALLVSGVGNLWADDVFKDVTSTNLTNAGFEGDYSVYKYPRGESNKDRAIYLPTGWTINYQSGKEWDMTALKDGDLSWSSFSSVPSLGTGGTQTYRIRFNNSYKDQRLELSQSVTLPKSTYKLEANWYISRTDAGDGYIKIDDTRYNASTATSWQNFSQPFTSTGSAITILFGAYHSATTEKFYAFDNFKIYWNLTQSLTDLLTEANAFYTAEGTSYTALKDVIDSTDPSSIDAEDLEAQYKALDAALKLAQARKDWLTAYNTLDELDETALPDAAETAITGALGATAPATIEEYNTAKATLQALIDSYAGIKAAYEKLSALIDLATSEKENSTGNKTDFTTAINTATDNVETRTAADVLTSDYNTLETARQTYVTSGAEPAAGYPFEVTFKIVNPSFENDKKETNNPAGWTIPNKGNQYGAKAKGSMSNVEGNYYFNNWQSWWMDCNVEQTISSLPNGRYEVTAVLASYSGTSANLQAGSGSTDTNMTGENNGIRVSVNGDVTGSSLTIRARAGRKNDGSLLRVDDFTLSFIGLKPVLSDLITSATALTTTNVGDEAFQIPSSAASTLSDAIGDAQTVYENDDAYGDAIQTAINNLNTAIEAFQGAALVAPSESTPYNLYLSDGGSYAKTLTFKDGNPSAGTYAIGLTEDAGSAFNQAVHFKAVDGETNQYNIYIEDASGTKHYLCTGLGGGYASGTTEQIRVTTTEANALAVLLVASNTEDGVYYLKNTESSNALIGTSDGGFYTTTKYNKFNINTAAQCGVPVAITSGKWGTRIFPFEVTSIPDGLEAYTITGTSGDAIVKSDALATISANTPVLLKASKNVNTSVSGYGVAKTNTYTTGLLTGVYTEASIAASTEDVINYVLQTQTIEEVEKQAFYKVTGTAFTATPYRCYLTVDKSTGVKAFYLDGDETAVSSVKADELQGATIYNLAGQRVSKAQKGVYIINGKKVAVK